MSEATIAALAGIIVALALRLIDMFLPKDRHFKFVERWTAPDEPAHDEDEKG